MKIIVETIDDREQEISELLQLSYSDSYETACASLSFTYKGQRLDEVVSVKAYQNGKLFFFGYCDCQKQQTDGELYTGYIYARSSACLLVDNEAVPFTYNKITASSLCEKYAAPLGFKSKLPDIYCHDLYQVAKGTSCYGAINQFVSLLTQGRIYVTPENEIIYLESSKEEKSLNHYNILSCSFITNRSEPYSNIKFKKSVSLDGYSLNMSSQTGKSLKLNRLKYINLSALPLWQREYTILRRLRSSYERYKLVEITVEGFADEKIGQRFFADIFGERIEDYILDDIRFTVDDKGERTRLTLRKNIDLKEITYVD